MPSARRRRQQSDDAESEEDVPQTQRRRRAPVEDDSEEDDVEEEAPDEMEVDGDESASQDQVVKKLVRYALACEYQRRPIKRAEVSEKVMARQRVPFKRVFELAQIQLKTVFGMEMVELPGRDKVTLKDRRAAQKSKGTSKTTASWMLTTILPKDYRTNTIVPPVVISSSTDEAAYIAICTLIVSVIQLNPTKSIADHKLTRYLQRLNASENMPMDKTASVLSKMQKQGYIVQTVDKSGDDETIDWRVGPRGKVEIGNKGIIGLVTQVYGDTPPGDLKERMHRSLGIDMKEVDEEEEEAQVEPEVEQNGGSSRRRSRRRADDD